MFKIGIFVQTKDNFKLVRWLGMQYPSHGEANSAVIRKNQDLGVDPGCVRPGQRFAMYAAV